MDPGSAFGPYRIEWAIRRGGMGVIYLAVDTRLDRRVALKVLGENWLDQPDYRERFLRETRVAASLDHPHILPVFEAGEIDGLPFLAMRYVEGDSLDAIVRKDAPMTVERAAGLVAQIAGALDAAHAAGLVHRDVKPGNVLVASTQSGEHAYLTDFGVAKSLTDQSAMTRAGELVGTVDYVAPEHIEGHPIDQRVDVYSLACLLFELLTGSRPFSGGAQVSVLYAHVHAPRPTLSESRPGAPAALDETLRRGMAVDPANRFASAGEFAREVQSAIEAGGDSVPLAGPSNTLSPTDRPTVVVQPPPTHGAQTVMAPPAAVEPAEPARAAGTPATVRSRSPVGNRGVLIGLAAVALLLGGLAVLGAGLGIGRAPSEPVPSEGDRGTRTSGNAAAGFSCETRELTAPTKGRWRLFGAEYDPRERLDYLRLNLRREGDHEHVASATASVVAPDDVADAYGVEPPGDADAVLVISFNGAVDIGGPWGARPNYGALREFRVARGREGNVHAVIGVNGQGCFTLNSDAWSSGEGQTALVIEISKD